MASEEDLSRGVGELSVSEQHPEQQEQHQPEEEAAKQGKKQKQKQKQKKQKKKADGGGGASAAAAAAAVLPPPPAFVEHRIAVFDRIAEQQAAERAANAAAGTDITITLPDGATKPGTAHVTSAYDVARGISKRLAESAVACKVDGELRDLTRPLDADCALEILTFDQPDAQHVFWHSSAHMLGQAIELKYGAHLCIGPALEDGFYYDAWMDSTVVSEADFAQLDALVAGIAGQKQPFVRLEARVTKDEALDMFSENRFKVALINDKVADGTHCTVYRCGPLVDLCRGPHVPHTGMVKAMMVTKNSSAYWLGSADNESLQRVYGVSFPDKKRLAKHKEMVAEAARRDHRVLGKDQELFFFHPLSPGSAFMLPHGSRIYMTLVKFMQAAYRDRGYEEVLSPNIYDSQLWKTSGHWQNYQENMFTFKVEGRDFGLKPMNCPGHCLMFAHRVRSYRELPIRFADFGVLHRNELSGALTGLTRVRRFQQDDAHIFCSEEQIAEETAGVLDFIHYVYSTFGYTFDLVLSTRPEKYMGDVESWNRAEESLRSVLDAGGWKWTLNPGDGAFYGPKIDINIRDALGRLHQCATVQLDFQVRVNFDLWYEDGTAADGDGDTPAADAPVDADSAGEGAAEPVQRGGVKGRPRPVIIHRAILGSVERFMAILIEHTGGKWPFWVSPRQAMVVPVSQKTNAYAQQVQRRLWDAGYYVDVDVSDRKMQRKVREAQIAQVNYILVVGAEEESRGEVNVRLRDTGAKQKSRGAISVDALLEEWDVLRREHK